MATERFTFVKHKLTGQRLFVIDSGIIIVRIAHPDIPGFGLEVMEIHEEEVEAED